MFMPAVKEHVRAAFDPLFLINKDTVYIRKIDPTVRNHDRDIREPGVDHLFYEAVLVRGTDQDGAVDVPRLQKVQVPCFAFILGSRIYDDPGIAPRGKRLLERVSTQGMVCIADVLKQDPDKTRLPGPAGLLESLRRGPDLRRMG